MSDYELERIDDHVEQAPRLFLQQYKGKPRIAAILASLTKQCQELEDFFWALFDMRFIDRAEGVHLDVLGRRVGQQRIGPDDETYRLFLRARILVNRSRGRDEDLTAVARALLQELGFKIRQVYPASLVVEVLDPLTTFASEIAGLLRDATGAGIGLNVHYATTPPETTFTFSSSDVAEEDAERGFDDGTGTTGGFWASAI